MSTESTNVVRAMLYNFGSKNVKQNFQEKENVHSQQMAEVMKKRIQDDK